MSVWGRTGAQTLSFEWPCESTPFSSFRVGWIAEGCILSRCFFVLTRASDDYDVSPWASADYAVSPRANGYE